MDINCIALCRMVWSEIVMCVEWGGIVQHYVAGLSNCMALCGAAWSGIVWHCVVCECGKECADRKSVV